MKKLFKMIRFIKRTLLIFTIPVIITFLISSDYSTKQDGTEDIHKKSEEIISWINAFEDGHSPERIMKGTFDDKVNLEYEDGILIINTMIWQGGALPIIKVRYKLEICDIQKIEAFDSDKGEYKIVDMMICANKESITMDCKEYKGAHYSKCSFADAFFADKGYCSLGLRFKFYSESESNTKRVYNALETLARLHGASPTVGSMF